MRVGAANESVLEWINSVLLFNDKAALDGVAHVVFGDGAERVLARLAGLPELFEVALFVGGAETGRAFGVSFDLENLSQRFCLGPSRETFGGERSAVAIPGIECDAPAEVGIVRNGDHLAIAGAIFFQPLPESLGRVVQVGGAEDGIGVSTTTEDHIPMQHAETFETGGPFESCERREFAGLVEFVGILLNLLPDAAGALEAPVLLVGHNAVADVCTPFGWIFPKSAGQIQHRL